MLTRREREVRGGGAENPPLVVSDEGEEMGAAALGPAKCLSLSLQLSANRPPRRIRAGARSSCNNHLGAAASPNVQPGNQAGKVGLKFGINLHFGCFRQEEAASHVGNFEKRSNLRPTRG